MVFVCHEEEEDYPYCHTWIILDVLRGKIPEKAKPPVEELQKDVEELEGKIDPAVKELKEIQKAEATQERMDRASELTETCRGTQG